MNLLFITFLTLPVILITYYFWLQGRWDGVTYSRKGDLAYSWNEHRIPGQIRAVTYLILISGMILGLLNYKFGLKNNLWLLYVGLDAGVLFVYSVFAYSFWHNAAYGLTKDEIRHKKRTLSNREAFRYQSPDDTAKYKQDFESRRLTFFMALLILAADLLIKAAHAYKWI